jgi:hypothetical protein
MSANGEAVADENLARDSSPVGLLNRFFDSWRDGKRDELGQLLTEDVSIHWKSLNPVARHKWITWTRDIVQYCSDEECTIKDDYQGMSQDVRDFDKFVDDMSNGFQEDISKRVVNQSESSRGAVVKATTEGQVTNSVGPFKSTISSKMRVNITTVADKIKDIVLEGYC